MPASRYPVTCPSCSHEFEVAVSVATAKAPPPKAQPNGELYAKVLRRDPCSYCGAPPVSENDHIVPVRRHRRANGSRTDAPHPNRDWDNRTAACASCNAAKYIAPLLHFLHERNSGEPAFGSRAYFWAHPEAPVSLVKVRTWKATADPESLPVAPTPARAPRPPSVMLSVKAAAMEHLSQEPLSGGEIAGLLGRHPDDKTVRRALHALRDDGLIVRATDRRCWVLVGDESVRGTTRSGAPEHSGPPSAIRHHRELAVLR